LKAVVATMTPADFYDGLNYLGGAFTLGSALHWAILQSLLGALHGMAAGEDVGARFGAVLPLIADEGPAQRTLPLSKLDVADFFSDWIAHPTRDAYWETLNETLRLENIVVPVMHRGGWFDIFLSSTL